MQAQKMRAPKNSPRVKGTPTLHQPVPVRPAEVEFAAEPTPVKAESRVGLVQRPVNFVLDVLPTVVGSRMRPIYRNWGEPAVTKVDDILLAAADKGSKLAGGAKQRLFKASSTDAAKKPGMLTRTLMAAERAVDWALPLPKSEGTDENSEDLAQLSVIGRTAHLVSTVQTRSFIHMEVKVILLKVRAKVWYDLNVVPPCSMLKSKTLAVRDYSKNKTLAVRNYSMNKTLAVRDYSIGKATAVKETVELQNSKAQAFVAGHLLSLRKACEAAYTRVASKAKAVKASTSSKVFKMKGAVSTKMAPYIEQMQKLLKPVTDRLSALLKRMVEMRKRALASALAKKAAVVNKAKTTFEPAEEYAAMKYDQAKLTSTKYVKASIDLSQRTLNRVLGPTYATQVTSVATRFASKIGGYSGKMA